MRSLTRGNFKIAIHSLRSRRGRSLLTMFGIIVSVAAVISIAAIGQGVKEQISGQINHYGKDLLTIRPGQSDVASNGYLFRPRPGVTLTPADLDTVRKNSAIGLSAPLALVEGVIRGGDHQSVQNAPVIATESDLSLLLNQTVAYGSFLDSTDQANDQVVLGSDAAEALFSEQVPLGRTFTFRGHEFVVHGIFNRFPNSSFSSEVDFNKAIFISYATGKELTNNNMALYEILAKPKVITSIDSVASSLTAALAKNHGDGGDIQVLKQSDTLAETSGVLRLLTGLVTGAAAVALLVGGIGIMNIMLVSVTERMHEVGIRKAIGATNRQIMSEFVSEAAVLSVTGALIGVLVAGVVVAVFRVATTFTPIVQWPVVVIAAAVAIIVGIVFGSIPALKAARKDPIAALRGE